MPVRNASSVAPRRDGSRRRIAPLVSSTALIAMVLGVLPVAWHASLVWQIIGCLVSLALVVHTARVAWREVFSTSPRDLGSA
jgi:hypothetical protein